MRGAARQCQAIVALGEGKRARGSNGDGTQGDARRSFGPKPRIGGVRGAGDGRAEGHAWGARSRHRVVDPVGGASGHAGMDAGSGRWCPEVRGGGSGIRSSVPGGTGRWIRHAIGRTRRHGPTDPGSGRSCPEARTGRSWIGSMVPEGSGDRIRDRVYGARGVRRSDPGSDRRSPRGTVDDARIRSWPAQRSEKRAESATGRPGAPVTSRKPRRSTILPW